MQILEVMDYAVYRDDITHIILDNLQFMMQRSEQSTRGAIYDKFESQDIIIEKFRKFATLKNVPCSVLSTLLLCPHD